MLAQPGPEGSGHLTVSPPAKRCLNDTHLAAPRQGVPLPWGTPEGGGRGPSMQCAPPPARGLFGPLPTCLARASGGLQAQAARSLARPRTTKDRPQVQPQLPQPKRRPRPHPPRPPIKQTRQNPTGPAAETPQMVHHGDPGGSRSHSHQHVDPQTLPSSSCGKGGPQTGGTSGQRLLAAGDTGSPGWPPSQPLLGPAKRGLTVPPGGVL
ncbi:proline-rich protein 2-like [Hippopotamus amphibius kiboko]|uniref:proline-rich protein 2-like n=1 Tax=Hippopotamus amphibius kiboko TaxID=575201 RepID=UPI0025963921|nr:proline-rich protein 2-like [Hippopotamus amphibius kiboko]